MFIIRKAKQCKKHFNKQKHKPNPTNNSIPNWHKSPLYNNNLTIYACNSKNNEPTNKP
jgi:hypothetical protein